MRLKSSDRRRYEKITPSPSEWAMAFKLFQCLKKFYDLTESRANELRDLDTADLLVDNGDDELENYLYESSGLEGDDMNELDKYMADPPLRLSGHFDILAWWKNQIDEYPVLAKIARDLLAVQVSTVASESAFSAGGRVVDPFRSRLDPEMVQALICMKDWVAAGRRGEL
jgi:hypothetical protein